MKHSVIFDDYDQFELKPPALLKQYVALIEQEVRGQLLTAPLAAAPCPACGSAGERSSFGKFGLRYVECDTCATLYISPRPPDAAIARFYRQSRAGEFWHNEFSRETSASRAARVVKPRLSWIADTAAQHLPGATHYVDVNTNQLAYVPEIAAASFCKTKTLVDPFVDPGQLGGGGVAIIDRAMHESGLERAVDIVSLFEVIDRTSDVDGMLAAVARALRPGGLCFMTATLASGFDIQVLGERAANLYPPDRLNVFSLEGLQTAVSRHGFEYLEVSTPGIFDLANIEFAMRQEPDSPLPRFITYLLSKRGEAAKQALQEFLQMNLLSSYGRLVLRRSAA